MKKEELLQLDYNENKWINVTMYVLILVLTLLIIFFNLFSLCTVVGESMENTLVGDQRVLLFRVRSANAGDIVVFNGENYNFGNELIIKRVIATGGQRFVFAVTDSNSDSPLLIYIDSGDGFKLLDETDRDLGQAANYLHSGTRYKVLKIDNQVEVLTDIPDEYINTVTKDCYFVMGDNRNNSTDSRAKGFVNKKDVVGVVVAQLKPDSAGEKFFRFVYGDNGKTMTNDELWFKQVKRLLIH